MYIRGHDAIDHINIGLNLSSPRKPNGNQGTVRTL